MRVAFFSTKPYDKQFFMTNNTGHQFTFLESRLTDRTVELAAKHDAVCVFVNDTLSATVIHSLHQFGIRLIALRCAGFNNVDLQAAEQYGIPVARVPAYSPASVAEHTIALILTLNRKIHRAHNRVREGDPYLR